MSATVGQSFNTGFKGKIILPETKLNYLVLLCNCIRIMSLNTYNKNVNIIWHYCIISHIKPWFLKTIILTNIKKDALKYMINRLWYGIFHITCHINPRPMGVSDWYDIKWDLCAVMTVWVQTVKWFQKFLFITIFLMLNLIPLWQPSWNANKVRL
jgi:hypothetical protein